jgi:hypothetical protein
MSEERAFFEQMVGCRDAYRRLADCIHETLSPSRALDLGAGLGYVSRRLCELGWDACASDLYAPEGLREGPAEMWLSRIDLKIRPVRPPLYRVVICTETAEHIPEPFADAVVANVALRATHYIVWSAAQPGQEWPGHVNLQLPSYWLGKFVARGWAPDYAKTERLRGLMVSRHAQHEYAATNFYVLGRA